MRQQIRNERAWAGLPLKRITLFRKALEECLAHLRQESLWWKNNMDTQSYWYAKAEKCDALIAEIEAILGRRKA